ncbi:hypothetical protein JMM63_17210 [Rhodovulum sulfidophilum]|uniref:hypothetical protein n=1 Tax=Rhodovulum sulfidophilum TaxID=35806 RepID=UPI00192383A8|nr:hypothetical protein [Rhodovulum sulfidophilum]MBL3597285.1 hypothetical protein [Rhodovulum sulfidophilum]
MVIRVVHLDRNPLIRNSRKVDQSDKYAFENKGKCYALSAHHPQINHLNLNDKSWKYPTAERAWGTLLAEGGDSSLGIAIHV